MINDTEVVNLNQELRNGKSMSRQQRVAELERKLYRGCTLVVFDGATRLVIDSTETASFWQSLLDAETLDQRTRVVFEEADYDPACASEVSTSQWKKVLQEFQPSASLRQYVEHDIESCCTTTEDEFTDDSRQLSLNDGMNSRLLIYTLNTIGMLLVVISLGVLIHNRPTPNLAWDTIVNSSESLSLTKKCVVLSVVLSVFDLISTTTAASSAEFGFIEVNPFAAPLIGDPTLLTVIKLLGTGLSAGLLWSQQKYVGAQKAAWWICFVLTLVTVRWVVVDSLFHC